MKKIKLLFVAAALLWSSSANAQSLTIVNHTGLTVLVGVYAFSLVASGSNACDAVNTNRITVHGYTTLTWCDPVDVECGCASPACGIDPTIGYYAGIASPPLTSVPSDWAWTMVNFEYLGACSGPPPTNWGTYIDFYGCVFSPTPSPISSSCSSNYVTYTLSSGNLQIDLY